MYCTEQMRETYNVWSKNLKGRHSLEDLDKNGFHRTVKKESGNWICLALDSEEWRAVLKFRRPMGTVKFLAR